MAVLTTLQANLQSHIAHGFDKIQTLLNLHTQRLFPNFLEWLLAPSKTTSLFERPRLV